MCPISSSEIQLDTGNRPNLVALFLNGIRGAARKHSIRLIEKIQRIDKHAGVLTDGLTCGKVQLDAVIEPVIRCCIGADGKNVSSLVIQRDSCVESLHLVAYRDIAHVFSLTGKDEVA